MTHQYNYMRTYDWNLAARLQQHSTVDELYTLKAGDRLTLHGYNQIAMGMDHFIYTFTVIGIEMGHLGLQDKAGGIYWYSIQDTAAFRAGYTITRRA